MSVPLVGISSCLLGNAVRFDGGHKRDPYIVDLLGRFVQWEAVCPEVESGLPIPREALRLVQGESRIALITAKSGKDYTDRMIAWSSTGCDKLEKLQLAGFIFKTRSPSSAMKDAKIYDKNGSPSKKGPGIFASIFMERFPHIPVEDEGRLHNREIRENFIERIFAYHRYMVLTGKPGVATLITFHNRHKYQLMAHDPAVQKELGRLVAGVTRRSLAHDVEEYGKGFMAALQKKATPARIINVFHHMIGYVKKQLTADEKEEFQELLDRYRKSELPLIVPVTLMNHYVRKYDVEYLKGQWFLEPHPHELMLRNHV